MRDTSNESQSSRSSSVSELSSAENAVPLSQLFRPRTPAYLNLDLSPLSDKALTPADKPLTPVSSNGLSSSPALLSDNTSKITSPTGADMSSIERICLLTQMNELFDNFATFLTENRDQFFKEEVATLNIKFKAAQEKLEDLLSKKDYAQLESGLSEFEVAFINLQDTVDQRVEFINKHGRGFFLSLKEKAGSEKTSNILKII